MSPTLHSLRLRPWTPAEGGCHTAMTQPDERRLKDDVERRLSFLERRVGFHLAAHQWRREPPTAETEDDVTRRLELLEWRAQVYRRDWT